MKAEIAPSKISKQSSLNDRDLAILNDSKLAQKEINYQKLADLVKDQRNIRSLSQFSKNSSFHQADSENQKYFNMQSKDINEFPTGLIDQEIETQPHKETQVILEKCVEGIQPQFQQVLAKHESDFVQAYRGHMQKVQKELLFLKSKANETAGKILNDDSITRLQGQIGWFKNEATKLDAILEGQKRELQKMKNRQSNLKEDRKFLRDQVKDARKNNKLLEVALKKTEDQNSLLKKFLEKNQVKRVAPTQADKTQLSPKQIINQTMAQFKEPFITQQVPIDQNDEYDAHSQQQNQENKKDQHPLKNLLQISKIQQQNMQSHDMLSQESSDFKIKEFVLDLFKRGYQKEKVELKIAKFFRLYDLSRDDRIEDLKKQVEIQKKMNLKLRSSCAQDYSEKSEVENLFLDCVDECKKEILKKKSMSHGAQQSQARFQNNIIAENTFQDPTNGLMEQVVLNKEALITTFEEIFGTGGYVGSTIGNLEHQIKQKKYSLISQANHNNNSMSYFSNATTKDNQSEEAERINIIMNAPIENLINNMSEYSFNIAHPYQNTAQNFNPSQGNSYGIRKHSLNSVSVTTKRASTAGGKGSTQANTALTHYNDLLPLATFASNYPQMQKSNNLLLNQHQQINQSNMMGNSSNSFLVSTKTNQNRAATSQSHQRRLRLDNSNFISSPGEEIVLIDRSRQNQVKPLTQMTGGQIKNTKSQERSFSVRNGKLMMNNTQSSFNK